MNASKITFQATLFRPAEMQVDWSFLRLPQEASARLPSRGMVSVVGALNGVSFQATLEPDGEGGHWLKVEEALRDAGSVEIGQHVEIEIAPVEVEPEPAPPPELLQALATAEPKAREVWAATTPLARRDWVQWIESAKKPETRLKRIANACDMLAKGKRRPCCFDRSGMYSKSLRCPVPEDVEKGA